MVSYRVRHIQTNKLISVNQTIRSNKQVFREKRISLRILSNREREREGESIKIENKNETIIGTINWFNAQKDWPIV